MITWRAFRAIVRLRWQLLKNSVSGSRKRDALEQMSRTLALVVPILVAALSIGSLIAVTIVGFLGGRAIGTGLLDRATGILILRLVLLAGVIAIVGLALAAPAQTASSRYTRLLLLPIPRRALHLVEVASGLLDPWLVVIAAGLMAFAAGLLAGGEALAAAAALGAAAGTVAILVCAGSFMSFLVAWLMRNRRRGEMFTLLFVLAMTLLSFIPAMASRSIDEREPEREDGRQRRFNVVDFNNNLPAWSRYLPTEVHGRIITDGIAGRPGAAAAGSMLLLAQAGVLFAASASVHRRMLDSLEGEAKRRRPTDVRPLGPRLPWLSAGASVVAWTLVRGSLRTVRGRLTLLLPGPMLGMLTVAFRGLPEQTWATFAADQGYALFGVGVLFTLLSVQPISMNVFGSDRAGLTMQLLAPVSDRELAWGKVAGFAMITALGAAICLGCAAVVSRSGSPAYWLAVTLAGGAAVALLAPATLAFSALFPVASDLSKTGAGGNPHPVPTIAGMLLSAALFAPGVAIIALAEFMLRQPWLAPLFMLLWLAVAAAIAIPLVNLAARLVAHRRENLALVAQGR